LGYGITGVSIPRFCQGKLKEQAAVGKESCPQDPYVIIPE